MVGQGDPPISAAERRLQDLDITLPAAPTPLGAYVESVQTSNLLFLTGMLPIVGHRPQFLGRIGKELDADAGRAAAYITALNALATAKEHLGSLDRISRVIRQTVFIATFGDFVGHAGVADGASILLRDVFGSEKASVRTVIGVASLPLGVPIEFEVIFEIAP